MSDDLDQIAAACEHHAGEIAKWREDDDQGPVCIELACDAETLLRKAADALLAVREAGRAETAARIEELETKLQFIEGTAKQLARAADGHKQGEAEWRARVEVDLARIRELEATAERHRRLCLAELGGDAVWPCGCHIRIVDSLGTTELLSGKGHEPCDHHAAVVERGRAEGQPARRACLDCEGHGVIRKYINRAGDYIKDHCAACQGTGRVVLPPSPGEAH